MENSKIAEGITDTVNNKKWMVGLLTIPPTYKRS